MRRLIAPKKYSQYHDYHEKCCCGSKKLYFPHQKNRPRISSNNWAARNDSSHINAILHPENYLDSPCRWNTKNKEDTAKVVKTHRCLSPNNCYCREKNSDIPKPRILTRPKSCVAFQDLEKGFVDNEDRLKRTPLNCVCMGDEKRDDIDTCYVRVKAAKGSQTNTRDTEPILNKRDDEFLNKHNIGLEFTEQRKASEQFSKDEYEEYLRKIAQYEHNNELKDILDEHNYDQYEGGYNNEEVATILGTKRSYPESYSTNYVTESNFRSINDLANFRKRHFFETHAATDENYTDGHTCVHQFRLDDRLLPEPLNQDSFGLSRCTICSKPMEGSSASFSRSYFGSSRPTKTMIRNFAKCYEYGFIPKTVHMGDRNSRIEIKLSKDEVPKVDGILKKMKNTRFCNTLALRQQRMTL